MLLTVVIAVVVIAVVLFLVLREGGSSQDARSQVRMAAVRRSPRVPISIPVALHTVEESFQGKGQNISHGGMLVHAEAPLSVAQPIQVAFTLPEANAVNIPAVVSYKRGEAIGLRFDPTHHERHSIEKWVNSSVKDKAANQGS